MYYLGPKTHLSFRYLCAYRKRINWKHPEDLNQWICHNMVYGNHEGWEILADKFAVREYVKAKGYEDMLVPLITVYDAPCEIELDQLPANFVIKANNGSADAIVVTDKSQWDNQKIQAYFESIRKTSFGKETEERHYLKIPFKIIVEEMLDPLKQDYPSKSMIDYKLWYINGKFMGSFIVLNRTKDKLEMQWRDKNWNLRTDYLRNTNHHKISYAPLQPPAQLSKLIECGETLSRKQPFVRIDFYVTDGHPWFGEITLTSAGGLMQYLSSKALRELTENCNITNE